MDRHALQVIINGKLGTSRLIEKCGCGLVMSGVDPRRHYRRNLFTTFNVLEYARRSGTNVFAFASTSTVYGEPLVIQTPEDYGPLMPISVYGATKLAAEAMISAYAQSYGFRVVIFRLANVVGSRSGHGVIHGFIGKFMSNPGELEALAGIRGRCQEGDEGAAGRNKGEWPVESRILDHHGNVRG